MEEEASEFELTELSGVESMEGCKFVGQAGVAYLDTPIRQSFGFVGFSGWRRTGGISSISHLPNDYMISPSRCSVHGWCKPTRQCFRPSPLSHQIQLRSLRMLSGCAAIKASDCTKPTTQASSQTEREKGILLMLRRPCIIRLIHLNVEVCPTLGQVSGSCSPGG
ncbi:hypothetical protein BDV95DRAFT_141976 [Massariosphaeria phaeospora]|uniref:Uncharacterized protein n=1 Tax=Massariosphaeria phaeospora TaxID=100035 RepID=A0A7C8MXB6_9PLEO|nr:hypothetical protein BDV95DRAFT_141976 [Massariosphaeria phaeospora]